MSDAILDVLPSPTLPRTESITATLRRRVSRVTIGLARWFGLADNGDERLALQQAYVLRKQSKGGQSPELAASAAFYNPRWPPAKGEEHLRLQFSMNTILADNFSSSSDEDGERAAKLCHYDSLTFDCKAGMQYYTSLVAIDLARRRVSSKPNFFGQVPRRRRRQSETTGRSNAAPPKRKHQLRRNDTNTAIKLQSLPVFTPWFIYLMTLLQFVSVVVMCGHAYTQRQWAAIALTTTTSTCTMDPIASQGDVRCPQNFNGSLQEGAVTENEVNMWIGPTRRYLLEVGARYTPCMRNDNRIQFQKARERAEQCGVPPEPDNEHVYNCDPGETGYSCCRLSDGRAGLTSQEECASYPGSLWQQSSGNVACVENTGLLIVLRPCCLGLTSRCEMLTKDACNFYGGTWHATSRLCSEQMCLEDVCLARYGSDLAPNPALLNEPKRPDQWWRFFLPMFMHVGILHFVFNVLIQWFAGCRVERQAGFLRTMLIYWISGLGGSVVSAIFMPYEVSAGPSGAVYGLLGVLYVELFQSWQIVPRPWVELLKVPLGRTGALFV